MNPTVQVVTTALASGSGEGHGASFLGGALYLALVIGIIIFTLSKAKKDFGERVFTRPAAQLFEQVYVFVENLCLGIIGPHGRKYIPMIMTFWLVIFVGNMLALFLATSVTADFSFNFGMAVIAVTYVNWEGIKAHGLWGYIKHFAAPKLGGLLMLITPLIFSIEIVSGVMRYLSLSLRLYGNIDGGHQAAEALNTLTSEYLIAAGAFLLPIKLLTVVVQALIFCLLTCVYLALITQHEEEPKAKPATATT